MSAFKQVISASKMVLQKRSYLIAFLLLMPLMAFLLFLIPVNVIAGNSIAFQLKLFSIKDYLMLFSVAGLESLLLVMFFYLFRRAQAQKMKLAAFGHSNLGVISGLPAFLFGTKLCPMCIVAIFGFLGSGVVLSILQYRTWIFLASAAMLLLSIYSISRKINRTCEYCE